MIDFHLSQNDTLVCSDNETKFNCLRNYAISNGIIIQKHSVDIPQQNEV